VVALAVGVSAGPPVAVAATSSPTPAPDQLFDAYSQDSRNGADESSGTEPATASASDSSGGQGAGGSSGPSLLTLGAIALAAVVMAVVLATVVLPARHRRSRERGELAVVPPDARGSAPKVARPAPMPAVRAPAALEAGRPAPAPPATPERRETSQPQRRVSPPRGAPAPAAEARTAPGLFGRSRREPTRPPAPSAEPTRAPEPAAEPARDTRPPAAEPARRPAPDAEPTRAPTPSAEPTRPSAPDTRPRGPATRPAAPVPQPAPSARFEPAAPPAPTPSPFSRTEPAAPTPEARPFSPTEPAGPVPQGPPPADEDTPFAPTTPSSPVPPEARPDDYDAPTQGPGLPPLPASRAAERDALYEREFAKQRDSTQEMRERLSLLLSPGRDVQEATELLRAGRREGRHEGARVPARRASRAGEDDSCEIVVWRGRTRAQFHAVIPAAEGEGRWVGESPPFRWPRTRPIEAEGDALAAHAALVRALTRAGWDAEGQGTDWFAGTFKRNPAPGATEGAPESTEQHTPR